MSTYDKSELIQLLKDAQEIANESPESSRKEVYERLVDHMLKSTTAIGVPKSPRSTSTSQDSAIQASPSQAVSAKTSEWEQKVFDGQPEPDNVAAGNRQAQTVWAVIDLCRRGEVVGVTSIRSTIKDSLGVNPESKSNCSTTLKGLVPRHLSREKVGRGYTYRPTRYALEVFKQEDNS